jgi:chromosome segregation ATPase
LQIEEKSRHLDCQKGRLNAINKQMEIIRSSWKPGVIQLIAGISDRFSRYFSHLNCAGEVRLVSEQDYDRWGVEILVKFRDTEKLAPLTAHRQSGGERAVSTIMYLMSLQHFSRAPFCVVDEINQGMDPRN